MKLNSNCLGFTVGAVFAAAMTYLIAPAPKSQANHEEPKATTVEYLMVQSSTEIDSTNDVAMSNAKRADFISALSDSAGYCGNTNQGMGGNDAHFDGTSMGAWIVWIDKTDREPGRQPSQVFMNGTETVGQGKHFSSFRNLYSDATCTLAIDGTTYTFKKYYTTCDNCLAKDE